MCQNKFTSTSFSFGKDDLCSSILAPWHFISISKNESSGKWSMLFPLPAPTDNRCSISGCLACIKPEVKKYKNMFFRVKENQRACGRYCSGQLTKIYNDPHEKRNQAILGCWSLTARSSCTGLVTVGPTKIFALNN